MQPSKYSKGCVMTDVTDYSVNKMSLGFLFRFRANHQQHHSPTAEGAEEHPRNLVAGCQVTSISRASSTTSVILRYLPLKHDRCFVIPPVLAHPDKKHLLPDAVPSLRLSLHAELVGTPAGGLICDVSHLQRQKMRQSCFQPDTDCGCERSG